MNSASLGTMQVIMEHVNRVHMVVKVVIMLQHVIYVFRSLPTITTYVSIAMTILLDVSIVQQLMYVRHVW